MMDIKLYENLQEILRAPWINLANNETPKKSTTAVNVEAIQIRETSAPLETNLLAGRKRQIEQNQKQLQQQDMQDKDKIRKGISGW